jgi:hypothetical protein
MSLLAESGWSDADAGKPERSTHRFLMLEVQTGSKRTATSVSLSLRVTAAASFVAENIRINGRTDS